MSDPVAMSLMDAVRDALVAASFYGDPDGRAKEIVEVLERNGYAVVPVEPTVEMAVAGMEANRKTVDNAMNGAGTLECYAAMLAARPKVTPP